MQTFFFKELSFNFIFGIKGFLAFLPDYLLFLFTEISDLIEVVLIFFGCFNGFADVHAADVEGVAGCVLGLGFLLDFLFLFF